MAVKPRATFHFPTGFLWGTATAAYQVEGNTTNSAWWDWEQQPGRIRNGDRSGLACDWWGGRWREDFDRAAEGGQNAHRLSVEWSRIQPTPDRWAEDAIDHYRQMARGLVERGMTPMVTLHHFSDPRWFLEQGGWSSEACVEKFAAFVRKVVEALKEYVSTWVTINEPNVFAYCAYVIGVFPPGEHGLSKAFPVMENLVRAHAAAYQVIHALQPGARVGLAINYQSFHARREWFLPDRWVARIAHTLFNEFFPRAVYDGRLNFIYKRASLPQAAHTQDFIGINYYTRYYLKFNPISPGTLFADQSFPPEIETGDNGWYANTPDGMFEALRWGRRFGLPMMVTENGIEDAEDRIRPRYLAEHVHELWRAVNFNYPVKGYFHWTLVDNFEWERGWTQRFGLWALDRETQVRRKRPSANLYAEMCKENGLSAEMVEKYCPEVFEKLFPV
jgi:beta-glucosidase